MSLIHGKSITSEQVENIVSRRFTPSKFASLCNSIIWASAGRRCSSLPSFTERVNVKDGGIDAEWQTDLPDDGKYSSPLLGPGLNVFQHKLRDIFSQGRNKTFTNIMAGLKGAIKELHDRTGRRPERYVLFTNLDLTHFTEAQKLKREEGGAKKKIYGQKVKLKKNLLEGYDQPDSVKVEILGSAELAAFLNDLPHLRSAFFICERFSTWQEAWLAHTREKLIGATVKLVGREKELADLRSMLDESNIRAIVLSGPHNIGKTRLALQATDHRPIETVFALDPRSMSVSDLLALQSPSMETIVVIEDPDAEKVEDFANQALVYPGLKLLITLPTAENVPFPSFGRDDRVQSYRLSPLSDSQAHELLKAAGSKLDYSVESWIIDQAGGNPGILLLAASLGEELRKSTENFTENVAKAFEKRVRRELGDTAIKILGLLSLLTHVGIKGVYYKEIELICSLFGSGLHPNTVLNVLPHLESAGIIKVAGLYVEVHPPIFANTLAISALRGRFTELLALFASLNQAGRLRLIRRLRNMRGEEITRFWDELFYTTGLFKDLQSALTNGYLLHLIAGTIPEKVVHLIEEGLKRMSLEDRFNIKGEVRREFMWVLEELLFRKKTSEAALHCLAMLAEAETENYGNNATGVFCECFHPHHPQFPLLLQIRANFLEQLFSSPNSVELRLIGIKAIETSLYRTGSVSLRRSSGPEPFDTRPTLTWGDVWNYIETLVDLLMTVAQSEEYALSKAALDALPHAIAECAVQGRPEVAVERFQTVTEWILLHNIPIPMSQLVEDLKFVHDVLKERRDQSDGAISAKLRDCIEKIELLISRLDKSDFRNKLRRWAGEWTREDDEVESIEEGKQIYRYDKELRGLAEEAVNNPESLSKDLLNWLCSDEAKKAHMFFWWLGRVDSEKKWLPKIHQIGQDKSGYNAFSAYCGGLRQTDRLFVNNWLDELTEERKITAEAIVGATGYLGGDLSGVRRMEILIQEKRINPVWVEKVLVCGGWIDSLNPDEYLRLVKTIAGPKLENAVAVIDFLGMWLHNQRPIEGKLAEFAWQCLEAAPPVTLQDAYDCDQLASKLAQADTERGFKLLESLLSQPYQSKCWNPISRHGKNKFWDTLHKADRKRALNLVFSIALGDPLQRFKVTWNVHEVIDQEADRDVLIEFASENERQAELVCESITTRRSGFWPIALNIIEKYTKSRKIKSALANGVEQIGQVVTGPWSVHLDNCRKNVEQIIIDPATPATARPWLEELEASLRKQIEQTHMSEIDEEVNDLRGVVEDPAAPERLWAIKRLLSLGKVDEILELLSKEDLLSILPKLELSEGESEDVRRKIEGWKLEI